MAAILSALALGAMLLTGWPGGTGWSPRDACPRAAAAERAPRLSIAFTAATEGVYAPCPT
ncbi:MAG: hypothetical protein H0S85_05055 [Desulfovibrionaceae bacterium]|nr:hypothetical protein [Desulfovibrionaceae bacterium]